MLPGKISVRAENDSKRGGVTFAVRVGRKRIAHGWAATLRDALEGCARAVEYETEGPPKALGPPIPARVVQRAI